LPEKIRSTFSTRLDTSTTHSWYEGFAPPVSCTERHCPFQHCPQGEVHTQGRCWCDPKKSFGELLPLPLCHATRVTYGDPGDRLPMVLLFEQIRCTVQGKVVVFRFRRGGRNTTADWTRTGAIGITVLFRPARLVIVIGGSARRFFGQCHRSSGGPPPSQIGHSFFGVWVRDE